MLRRSFLSRFAGAPAFFGIGGQSMSASAPKSPAGRFEAARHTQDDWFDQVPGRHRVIFDTWVAERFREAIGFAGNYFRANRDGYELADKDLAVVICVRHQTAPFAFNDAMWAKYGQHFSDRMTFTDPKTSEAPKTNLYGTQLSNLIKQGVHLAVCNLTTRAYTRILADATGANADDIYKELTTNTLGNSHFVPAGIVAVTRAQERGYSIVAIG
jgi:intracellular sulfur oxidation DsrE/DsrF family protein